MNSAMVKVAEWSDESKFTSIAAKFVRLYTNQETQPNRTFIVTTILEEPYVMETQSTLGVRLEGNNRFEGYCKDLADLVAERTGITCKLYTLFLLYDFDDGNNLVSDELRVVKDGQYGTEDAAHVGGWDGMVGELVRRVCTLFKYISIKYNITFKHVLGSGYCHCSDDNHIGA